MGGNEKHTSLLFFTEFQSFPGKGNACFLAKIINLLRLEIEMKNPSFFSTKMFQKLKIAVRKKSAVTLVATTLGITTFLLVLCRRGDLELFLRSPMGTRSQSYQTSFSSSVMIRPNKLECLHLAKTFQSSLTFAGSTRNLPKKQG